MASVFMIVMIVMKTLPFVGNCIFIYYYLLFTDIDLLGAPKLMQV